MVGKKSNTYWKIPRNQILNEGEHIILLELIETLEKEDPNLIIPNGFNSPHSYRGNYCDIAFEPAENITIREMIECAKEAIGKTYEGYKGGDFKMSGSTNYHISYYGECGEEIGKRLLRYIIKEAKGEI